AGRPRESPAAAAPGRPVAVADRRPWRPPSHATGDAPHDRRHRRQAAALCAPGGAPWSCLPRIQAARPPCREARAPRTLGRPGRGAAAAAEPLMQPAVNVEPVRWPAKLPVFGVFVSATTYHELADAILAAARTGQRACLNFLAVHGLMTAVDD